MIDLHSHILPGLDDGAADMETAIAMARMAVDDGIEVVACTPHIMPGVYDNTAQDIRVRVQAFNRELEERQIPLSAVAGCDAHIRPDFLQALRSGQLLTLHDTRYVLFEPPHGLMPPRLSDLLHNITVSGFVAILTHPERLRWIENNYGIVEELARQGVWMQITAGSLTGRFGKRPQYWAQKMLAEGLVSILATDAHNTRSRPPLLAEARDVAAAELGADEADQLVMGRPLSILDNADPTEVHPLPRPTAKQGSGQGFWSRLFGGIGA